MSNMGLGNVMGADSETSNYHYKYTSTNRERTRLHIKRNEKSRNLALISLHCCWPRVQASEPYAMSSAAAASNEAADALTVHKLVCQEHIQSEDLLYIQYTTLASLGLCMPNRAQLATAATGVASTAAENSCISSVHSELRAAALRADTHAVRELLILKYQVGNPARPCGVGSKICTASFADFPR